MPCYRPLSGYYSKVVNPATGKRGITFNRGASFSGAKIPIPCGQCVGCRLEKSRQWAMRCLHEKRLHKENCFVTLTYANEHLPPAGTLVKRDLSLFMKRLRNEFGDGIRFYGCGEYGDVTRRPHYHVILFNFALTDRKFYKNTKGGHRLDTSATLERIWGRGFCTVGDVTFDSAAYVARYVMKKVTGDAASKHYLVVDGDGVVHCRLPEFTLMSRNPGVGKKWYDKFGSETYSHDNCVVNGRLVRPPRYYDGKFELTDPVKMVEIRKKRKAARQYSEGLVDRRLVRERVQELNMRELKREL